MPISVGNPCGKRGERTRKRGRCTANLIEPVVQAIELLLWIVCMGGEGAWPNELGRATFIDPKFKSCSGNQLILFSLASASTPRLRSQLVVVLYFVFITLQPQVEPFELN